LFIFNLSKTLNNFFLFDFKVKVEIQEFLKIIRVKAVNHSIHHPKSKKIILLKKKKK